LGAGEGFERGPSTVARNENDSPGRIAFFAGRTSSFEGSPGDAHEPLVAVAVATGAVAEGAALTTGAADAVAEGAVSSPARFTSV